MTAISSLIKNDEARLHDERRKQVVKLEELQNEVVVEVKKAKDWRSEIKARLNTYTRVQQELAKHDTLEMAGYNQSNVSQRALTYRNASGNVTLLFTASAARHMATCLLAFQQPLSTALQQPASTALQPVS